MLFERLARDTWQKVRLGHQLKCKHLETTFNDNHIFDIAISRIPGVRIYKAKGVDEKTKGFDWEWWIGRPGRFWRYSVQAKLLAFYADRYFHLPHKVGPSLQIDILESFSQQQGSIPLYCFYNSVDQTKAQNAWHCPLPFDLEQLGCTLVPLDAVRAYVAKRKVRSFANIHADPRALPWRCVVTCPNIIDAPRNPFEPPNADVRPYSQLPRFAQLDSNDDGSVIEVDLPPDFYSSRLEGRPRAVAVIEFPAHQGVSKADIAKPITE